MRWDCLDTAGISERDATSMTSSGTRLHHLLSHVPLPSLPSLMAQPSLSPRGAPPTTLLPPIGALSVAAAACVGMHETDGKNKANESNVARGFINPCTRVGAREERPA